MSEVPLAPEPTIAQVNITAASKANSETGQLKFQRKDAKMRKDSFLKEGDGLRHEACLRPFGVLLMQHRMLRISPLR